MKNLAILMLVLAVMIGCATPKMPSEDVTLLTAARTGDRVRLTLYNGSKTRVAFNLCSSELQRADGAAWEPIQTDEVCTMELRSLAIGGSADFPKKLPPDLRPGQYRYVTNVEVSGQRKVLTSNPFRIE